MVSGVESGKGLSSSSVWGWVWVWGCGSVGEAAWVFAWVLHVIVINRRRGLYWFYKPEAERLLNQYRPTAPVNKYFLDHAVT